MPKYFFDLPETSLPAIYSGMIVPTTGKPRTMAALSLTVSGPRNRRWFEKATSFPFGMARHRAFSDPACLHDGMTGNLVWRRQIPDKISGTEVSRGR